MGGDDAAARGDGEREPFIDFVRAFSLVVVVVWHWAFTILIWRADGPHASNPIGFTRGMWLLTWLLQVMPLFFFVGGYANLRSYVASRRRGIPTSRFVARRLRRLVVPSVGLALAWGALMVTVPVLFEARWIGRATLLVLSPLWFIAVYVLIVALFPLWYRLHGRFGPLVVVWLAGIAAIVDIARFAHDVPWVGWVNMLAVWGLAHQLGFSYGDLVRIGDRRWYATMAWAGLFGLFALVWSGAYPGSMVGVPGERFSNMSPPSLAIVALVFFQAGVALLVRPWVVARLERPAWERANALLNRFAMPLFLFHTTGFAIALTVGYLLSGRETYAITPTPEWWLGRPLALVGPFVGTLPFLWAYALLTRRRSAAEVAGIEPTGRV
ncbi:MAG: hypothetical protein KatS3mg009_0723 [Acidimicrobiia bacterium]|nr:MAG: hypothetical protein KatS3mg009_0723 [Acidimicrobiia bacterium]